MKIQINFVLKKSDLKNIDQFLSLLKKKKKTKSENADKFVFRENQI